MGGFCGFFYLFLINIAVLFVCAVMRACACWFLGKDLFLKMCEGVVVRRGSFCVWFFVGFLGGFLFLLLFFFSSFFLFFLGGGVCVRVVFKKKIYLFVDV